MPTDKLKRNFSTSNTAADRRRARLRSEAARRGYQTRLARQFVAALFGVPWAELDAMLKKQQPIETVGVEAKATRGSLPARRVPKDAGLVDEGDE